jgi:uncharacterized YigZ family protein
MILDEALEQDHFNCIQVEGSSVFKDKGSKFLGFCYAVSDVEEAMNKLNQLRSDYHDARHFCYAYRISPEQPAIRYSDDGEPNNSAGIPIYNQLRAAELWNTLVVVVRYFGGTKLGVPGLINAYKEAAASAIADSKIGVEYLIETINIRFPYSEMNEVMRVVKDTGADLVEEYMGEDGGYLLGIRKSQFPELLERIRNKHLWQVI